MSVNRNKWKWLKQTDAPLDKLLPNWRTEQTPEVMQFMEELRKCGFTFVDSAHRAFQNEQGARLYYLVFASKSLTAVNFWAKISRDEVQSTLF